MVNEILIALISSKRYHQYYSNMLINKHSTKALIITCLCFFYTTLQSQTVNSEKMNWWQESRFGMFIHWGLYAVPAGTFRDEPIPGLGEWIMSNASIPV